MNRAVLPAAVLIVLALGAAAPAAQSPFERPGAPEPGNTVDELVFSRLADRGIEPARVASDAVFVRRVYLDVIGTLPAIREVRSFLASPDPDKRRALIDHLLERDEFADYWAMKWSDVLRVKSEFPINLWPNAVQAYHHWIRASLEANLPYDRFARALLTESGSNFRAPQVNFYRAVQSREPTALATAVALTFMGARTERWPEARLAAMAVFFSAVGYKPTGEWKEEIVFFDLDRSPAAGAASASVPAVFPDGTTTSIAAGRDPREVFAAWLTAPDNPWFARSVVNRVWFWLLGRGIVHEPDDLRPDNLPVNRELLEYLARELVASGYDLRHLYRLILNSTTYQLSSLPRTDTPEAEALFAHYVMRPLDAEVLIDAINQITGTTEPYSSAIPEPFTFTPPGQRAVALADGSITSPFLETLGRSPRDTGLLSERAIRATVAARLLLLNSSQVQAKLEQGGRIQALVQADARQAVDELYVAILSRPPTEEEAAIVEAYARAAAGNRRVTGLDVAWALINSVEFLYRH